MRIANFFYSSEAAEIDDTERETPNRAVKFLNVA